jgi:diguanylate cyclase (GGDEF)-like protein
VQTHRNVPLNITVPEQQANLPFLAIVMNSATGPRNIDGLRAKLAKVSDDARSHRSLLKLAEKHIDDLAYRDALTGLPNRASFLDEMAATIDAASSGDSPVALLKFDIDLVSELNEPLSYKSGDLLIELVAEALRNCFDTDDFVARTGTNEFAVIVYEQSAEMVLNLADDFIKHAAPLFVKNNPSVPIGICGGIAMFPAHGKTTECIIRNARIALLHAKARWPASIVLFDSSIRVLAEERALLIEKIWAGIKNKEFVLFYQPIIALQGGKVSSVEALMRWSQDETRPLPPSQFMVGFEDPTLSIALGEVALDLAIAQMRKWLDGGIDFGRIAVNLSCAQLRLPDLAEIILSKLDGAGVPPDRLTVELTENVHIRFGSDEIEKTARKLHESGVEIALDDFGTGYASLTHLRRFPISKLKIDKTFVQAAENRSIVEALIAMGHGLGIKLVAEGVENEDQLSRLKSCDFVQGFLFSEPLPHAQVAAFISAFSLKVPRRSHGRPRPRPRLAQKMDLDLAEFLAAEIAVVSRSGAIVYCNKKWNETAEIGKLSSKRARWNYVAECEASIKRGCLDAGHILEGLHGVLQGSLSSFTATYACPFAGLHRWYEVLISTIEIRGNRHASVMHVDVSAMQRDRLTGLPNRAMFDAQADLAITSARDTDCRTGIMILDIDNLKWINDAHGHATGDMALQAFAVELKKIVGPECLATRVGGDEFGVVLPVNHDSLLARRVRSHFESGNACLIESAHGPIFVSASVGAGIYPEDGTTTGELYSSADKAMYAHKRTSRREQAQEARLSKSIHEV